MVVDARHLQQYLLAQRLIVAGARTQTVVELTGLRLRAVRELYPVCGQKATTGQNTHSVRLYTSTQAIRLHSSIFVNIYRTFQRIAPPETAVGHTLLRAVEKFTAMVPDSDLNINKLWFLVKQLDAKRLKMVRCRDCKCEFLIQPFERTDQCRCPICIMRAKLYCCDCGTRLPAGTQSPRCDKCKVEYKKKRAQKTYLAKTRYGTEANLYL